MAQADPDALATAAPSLRRSALVQARVIWALMLREMLTRYGRHNIGFLWLFVEPMLFTLGVTALWYFAGMNHSSSLPITSFALTGYSTVLLWRNMPSRSVAAISANMPLMYHRNVRPIDIFASRIALEAAGATMSFFLLSLLFMAIDWMPGPENLLELAGAWLMTAWFGAALGLTLGALAERSELVEKLWHPAAYLLFPLSGAAFQVSAMPDEFQTAVLYVPMVHCTEMVREAYFGSKVVAHYDVFYLTCFNMALTFLGLSIERQVSRDLVPE